MLIAVIDNQKLSSTVAKAEFDRKILPDSMEHWDFFEPIRCKPGCLNCSQKPRRFHTP